MSDNAYSVQIDRIDRMINASRLRLSDYEDMIKALGNKIKIPDRDPVLAMLDSSCISEKATIEQLELLRGLNV